MGHGFKDARHRLDTTNLSDVVQQIGIGQGMHVGAVGRGGASSHETAGAAGALPGRE